MYTIELRLDTRGYDEYLEKKFKYGYKLKRALVNYFNMKENQRVNSDRYKELAERMQELNTRQDIIKDTKDKGRKKLLKAAYKELSEEVKKGWIELNDSYGLGNGKFVDYKKLGQASVMYERYASEGIINWSSFESMAQATKQGKVVVSVDVDKLAIKTLNVDTEEEVFFDIANDFGYSEKLSYYDRKLEESRRQSNPANYNADGTVKEGKRSWIKTKNYNTLLARKRTLWHKIKQSRKDRFHNIAKAIVLNCDEIVVIKEDFKALQKRKDYNPEDMKWTDSRKQKGAEIMFNAPYEFIELLKQKASYLGLSYSEIIKEKQ